MKNEDICKYCGQTKANHYHDIVLDRYPCVGHGTMAALLTFTPMIAAPTVATDNRGACFYPQCSCPKFDSERPYCEVRKSSPVKEEQKTAEQWLGWL